MKLPFQFIWYIIFIFIRKMMGYDSPCVLQNSSNLYLAKDTSQIIISCSSMLLLQTNNVMKRTIPKFFEAVVNHLIHFFMDFKLFLDNVLKFFFVGSV